jgi:hypothetical protein
MSWTEFIVTAFLALVGFGVMAGQGFKINRWVFLFWGAALLVGIFGLPGALRETPRSADANADFVPDALVKQTALVPRLPASELAIFPLVTEIHAGGEFRDVNVSCLAGAIDDKGNVFADAVAVAAPTYVERIVPDLIEGVTCDQPFLRTRITMAHVVVRMEFGIPRSVGRWFVESAFSLVYESGRPRWDVVRIESGNVTSPVAENAWQTRVLVGTLGALVLLVIALGVNPGFRRRMRTLTGYRSHALSTDNDLSRGALDRERIDKLTQLAHRMSELERFCVRKRCPDGLKKDLLAIGADAKPLLKSIGPDYYARFKWATRSDNLCPEGFPADKLGVLKDIQGKKDCLFEIIKELRSKQ